MREELVQIGDIEWIRIIVQATDNTPPNCSNGSSVRSDEPPTQSPQAPQTPTQATVVIPERLPLTTTEYDQVEELLRQAIDETTVNVGTSMPRAPLRASI